MTVQSILVLYGCMEQTEGLARNTLVLRQLIYHHIRNRFVLICALDVSPRILVLNL